MVEQDPKTPSDEQVPVEPLSVDQELVELDPEPLQLEPDPEPIGIEPIPVPPDEVSETEPISLVDDIDEEGPSKVHALRGSALEVEKHEFKRPVNVTGQGATRCRVFHSRIAEAPLEHMQKSINTWSDDAGIEIKHTSTVIGIMEGKNPEPNVIVLVWY